MFSYFERRHGVILQVLFDRLRASLLRARGAYLGDRTRIGRGCVIQRPWCLTTDVRVQVEHQVFIKVTDDNASIRLGREVFVGYGSEFDISEGLSIGNQVLIAPGCFITDHNHRRNPRQFIAGP